MHRGNFILGSTLCHPVSFPKPAYGPSSSARGKSQDFLIFNELAEITGFEPVPHGVTSRYCEPFNHTSIVGEEGFEPTYPKPVRHY